MDVLFGKKKRKKKVEDDELDSMFDLEELKQDLGLC